MRSTCPTTSPRATGTIGASEPDRWPWSPSPASARNIPDAILHYEVIGPRDIEQRVGLTGGHIFQGEILPQYLWDKRLTYKTPMDGVYLCGAATHPGGSVIAVNGRNAAMEILGR